MNNPLYDENMDDFFGDYLHNYQTEPDEMVWENIQEHINPLYSLGTQLENYEFEPEAMVWKNIEKEIAQPKQSEYYWRFVKGIGMAAILLFVVIVWDSSGEKNKISEVLVHSESQVVEGIRQPVVSNKWQVQNRKQQTQPIVSNKWQVQNRKQQTQPVVSNKQKATNKLPANTTKSVSQDKQKASVIIVQTNNPKSLPSIFTKKPKSWLETENLKERALFPSPVVKENSAKKSIIIFGGIALNRWKVKANKIEGLQEWKGEFNTTPTVNGGLMVEHFLSDNVSIQTGGLYQTFKTTSKTEVVFNTEIVLPNQESLFEIDFMSHNHLYKLNANGQKYDNNVTENAMVLNSNQIVKYLGIPLWITYRINPNQRLKIGLISGLNANILLQNKMELLDFSADGLIIDGFSLTNSHGLRNLNWSYTGGVQLTYPLSKQWNLYGQGLYNGSINPVNKTTEYLSTFSGLTIQTGLKLSF